MVEAGVIAIDSGAAVETVGDGMDAPTLSEAIKNAALLALGRAIDVRTGRRTRDRTADMTATIVTFLRRTPEDGDGGQICSREVVRGRAVEQRSLRCIHGGAAEQRQELWSAPLVPPAKLASLRPPPRASRGPGRCPASCSPGSPAGAENALEAYVAI